MTDILTKLQTECFIDYKNFEDTRARYERVETQAGFNQESRGLLKMFEKPTRSARSQEKHKVELLPRTLSELKQT